MKPSNYSKMTAPLLRVEFDTTGDSPFLGGCRGVADEIEVFYTVKGDVIYFMLVGEEAPAHSEPILLN